jgi:hypothetical protein
VRAESLCAGLKAGDVCVADRAYTDFGFLDGLRARGVFFVVRHYAEHRIMPSCGSTVPKHRVLQTDNSA